MLSINSAHSNENMRENDRNEIFILKVSRPEYYLTPVDRQIAINRVINHDVTISHTLSIYHYVRRYGE